MLYTPYQTREFGATKTFDRGSASELIVTYAQFKILQCYFEINHEEIEIYHEQLFLYENN